MSLPAELVEAYASLFVHSWSQYAVQQRNGSYWRVREPLTLSHLAAHLEGRWTLGTYLLDEAGCCAFAVLDADSVQGWWRLVGLAKEWAGQGMASLLEASRRGGHLWLHLAEPTPAHLVRAWLVPSALGLGVELYPKQDVLGPDGACSLIRLPLGIHRQARGWYPFVVRGADGALVPVGETVEACCVWAAQAVERVAVPLTVEDGAPMACRGSLGMVEDAHTASHWWVGCPGRGSIRAWCQAQDIREIIGGYVALDHQGVGSCPFKEHHYRGDMRPSFQVFGGRESHWYCYTWGRAGDLFDFLCLFYQISPHEAWERLRQGMLV